MSLQDASRKDPWRYRCPNGHASWHRRPGDQTPGNYYCECCQTYFDELQDMKASPERSDTQESFATLD